MQASLTAVLLSLMLKKQQQNPFKQLCYSFCQLYSPTDNADILFSNINSALVSHSNYDL